MPGENVQDWSVTAANNGNSDSSINFAEGQPRASVNNSSRAMMAAHAKNRNLHNGSITTGGTADAQTFTSGVGYTTVPTGLRVLLKIGPALTNTGVATLNMDGIGAVAVKDQLAADLAAGALVANSYAEFIYNGTNWIFLTTLTAPTAAPGDADASIANTAFVAAAIAATNIRVFTASGTYPTTTATCKVLVMCRGGGGGGGSTTNANNAGGGGGEGETSWKMTTAAALSAQAVTIGAGGASPGINANSNGSAGGTTSIGAIVTAGGGLGGQRGDIGGPGGAGGSGGTADWSLSGAPGQSGSNWNGASIAIYAAGGGQGGGVPAVAGTKGGGGGGGSQIYASGNGGAGYVVCYEYGVI